MKVLEGGRGGTTQRVTVEAWLREALSETDPGPASSVSLVHMLGGDQFNEVWSARVNPGLDIVSFSKVFKTKADVYAQDMSGMQQFALWVFYDNENEPRARHPFKVAGRSHYDGETEAPDVKGQTAQQMRHYETAMGQIFAQQQFLMKHTTQVLEDSENRARRVMSENEQLITIMKQTMIEKLNFEHGKEMEALKYKRNSEAIAKLLAIAPVLVNQLTGKQVFPESTTDTILLKEIAKILMANPDAIAMLTSIVPADKAGPFMARLGQIQDEMAAEARQQAALYPPSLNPEANAAGDPE